MKYIIDDPEWALKELIQIKWMLCAMIAAFVFAAIVAWSKEGLGPAFVLGLLLPFIVLAIIQIKLLINPRLTQAKQMLDNGG